MRSRRCAIGHSQFGNPVRTYRWKQVLQLLDDESATFEEIAGETLYAIELGLKDAAADFGLQKAFWLLTQVVHASREGDFRTALWKLDLSVPERASLWDVTGTFSSALRTSVIKAGEQTDIAEISLASALQTMTELGSRRGPDLFPSLPESVQVSIRRSATRSGMSQLGHEFFANFTYRYVGYILSRSTSLLVGDDGRFNSISNHSKFNEALELHCRQASRIVDKFVGDWYAKHAKDETLTFENAARFLHIAFRKLRAEIRRGGNGGRR